MIESTPLLYFLVEGEPVPQGSKRAFARNGRVYMNEDAGIRHASWRREVSAAAHEAAAEAGLGAPVSSPVYVRLTFYLRRGAGHYGTGRNERSLRPSAPAYPAKVPDVDKLARAVLDSLTGIAWVDDAQVVSLSAHKRFVDRFSGAEGVGVDVRVVREGETR